MRFFSCPWAFTLPLPSTFFCSKRNKSPFHTFTYFWLESITLISSARIISALSISVESISVSRGVYSPFSMPPFWYRNLLCLSFTIETASYKIIWPFFFFPSHFSIFLLQPLAKTFKLYYWVKSQPYFKITSSCQVLNKKSFQTGELTVYCILITYLHLEATLFNICF